MCHPERTNGRPAASEGSPRFVERECSSFAALSMTINSLSTYIKFNQKQTAMSLRVGLQHPPVECSADAEILLAKTFSKITTGPVEEPGQLLRKGE